MAQGLSTASLSSPGWDNSVGRDQVLPAPRVARVLYTRVRLPCRPLFRASRCGMDSTDTLGAAAAMAVDREAEGAGALLGPEEDIDDDFLSHLQSAS